MAQQNDLALNDGQASPVSHTFAAAGVDGKGVATWMERTTSSLVTGFFRLTMSSRLASKITEPNRHTLKLVMPTVVTETINGVSYSKVARQSMCTMDFIIASDSTLQERKDIIAYASNVLLTTTTNHFGYQIRSQDPVA